MPTSLGRLPGILGLQSGEDVKRLRRLAAFQNPEFYSAQRMRLSTFGKPRVICCAEDFPEYAALPRGCLDQAIDLLSEHGMSPVVQDQRFGGVAQEFGFLGQLSPRQEDAVRVLTSFDDGVFSAPTGFGKTVIAAWMIAHRKVNTLVLVHRRQLMDQWRVRLSTFLGLPSDSIGQIGGGRVNPTGVLDVGMIQTLNRGGQVDDIGATYGHVVVDECHHISAVSFEQVLKSVKAKYILGLTATPIRKDGRHPIIMMQCGPLRARLSPRMASRGSFEHVVIPRVTQFRLPDNAADATIQQIYGMLSADSERNAMILADVTQAVRSGRSPLVLTERTAHLKELVEGLKGHVGNIIVLRGGRTDRQRQQLAATLAAVPDSEERVIVATGRYAGEGFDDARLDTLFLALPISWKGTLQQYAGRLRVRETAWPSFRSLCLRTLPFSSMISSFSSCCREPIEPSGDWTVLLKCFQTRTSLWIHVSGKRPSFLHKSKAHRRLSSTCLSTSWKGALRYLMMLTRCQTTSGR